MAFFLVLISTFIVLLLMGRFGVCSGVSKLTHMRIAMSVALIMAGADHLVVPERYVPMIESFVVMPVLMVYVTGILEILGAIGLLIPKSQTLSGRCLALYFICVLPANINNAINGLDVPGLPTSELYYWVRVCLQPLAIWWVLKASEVKFRFRPEPEYEEVK